MTVLVDTSIWSLALRRHPSKKATPIVQQLANLIQNQEIVIIGAIRQEILSGIRHSGQFIKLRDSLRPFADLEVTTADYELAAEYFNTCRHQGIQGSNTDFLICAVAYHHHCQILTTDKDFAQFRQYIPINLYEID